MSALTVTGDSVFANVRQDLFIAGGMARKEQRVSALTRSIPPRACRSLILRAPPRSDATAALDAAVHAGANWRLTSPRARAEVLRRAYRRLSDHMAALRVAPGAAPDTEVGPLIDNRQRAAVHDLVEDAIARGARLVTGGARVSGAGSFYAA